jgi:methionyl-tRNA synthetase
VAHGWLLFEESKMSKSRGNIVRAETILDVLGADALRYFLLREIVFGQDGSFSFDAWSNATTPIWQTGWAIWLAAR